MTCMIDVILTIAGFEGVGLVFTGSADPRSGNGLLPGIGPVLYEADYWH